MMLWIQKEEKLVTWALKILVCDFQSCVNVFPPNYMMIRVQKILILYSQEKSLLEISSPDGNGVIPISKKIRNLISEISSLLQ